MLNSIISFVVYLDDSEVAFHYFWITYAYSEVRKMQVCKLLDWDISNTSTKLIITYLEGSSDHRKTYKEILLLNNGSKVIFSYSQIFCYIERHFI